MNKRTWCWLPAAVVVVLQIAYPLVHGGARNRLTLATVIVFAGVSFGYALLIHGLRYAGALVAVAGVGGFAAELLGVHTGVPFGDYDYTGGLGRSAGGVPLLIGAGWLMMCHPAVVVSGRLTRRRGARIVVAAVALASWDLFLDPQMVDAGHWRWRLPAPHLPGVAEVPLSNYGGWLLVALVMCALLVPLAGPTRAPADDPVIALWVWVWLSSSLAAAAFLGLGVVAAWCFGGMGLVGIPLLLRWRA